MNFGYNLRTLRVKKEMTQANLADAAKVTQDKINAWENDGVIPSDSEVNKLLEALGCKREDLFNGTKDERRLEVKKYRTNSIIAFFIILVIGALGSLVAYFNEAMVIGIIVDVVVLELACYVAALIIKYNPSSLLMDKAHHIARKELEFSINHFSEYPFSADPVEAMGIFIWG